MLNSKWDICIIFPLLKAQESLWKMKQKDYHSQTVDEYKETVSSTTWQLHTGMHSVWQHADPRAHSSQNKPQCGDMKWTPEPTTNKTSVNC